MVMIHGNKLYAFDGVSTTLANDATIYDYTIAGDELYVLRTSSQVCRTKNLLSYNCFDVAPLTARSIETLDDFVYVGNTLGQIYKAPIPDRPTTAFLPSLYYLLFDEDIE